MFIGEYSSQLTDKNRVALPKKLRDEMSENIFITRGYENCILILDQSRWENLIKIINQNPLLNLSVRDTKRFLLGGASEIVPDLQGRFVIPEGLKTFSKIDNEVCFIGVGEWIELWSKETWDKKLEQLSQNVADLAEKLETSNNATQNGI